jgi:organic hydroperoxide reductase OsmC/OhrA
VFRGDAARWNPAELLIAALSACHESIHSFQTEL